MTERKTALLATTVVYRMSLAASALMLAMLTESKRLMAMFTVTTFSQKTLTLEHG